MRNHDRDAIQGRKTKPQDKAATQGRNFWLSFRGEAEEPPHLFLATERSDAQLGSCYRCRCRCPATAAAPLLVIP